MEWAVFQIWNPGYCCPRTYFRCCWYRCVVTSQWFLHEGEVGQVLSKVKGLFYTKYHYMQFVFNQTSKKIYSNILSCPCAFKSDMFYWCFWKSTHCNQSFQIRWWFKQLEATHNDNHYNVMKSDDYHDMYVKHIQDADLHCTGSSGSSSALPWSGLSL